MANIEKEDLEKIVLLGIVTISVVVAVWMFLVSPDIKKNKKLKKELNELKTRLDNSQQLIRSVPGMTKRLKVLEANYAEYKDSLPKETGYSWFLEYVNRLGIRLNIEFESMTPKEKEGLVVFDIGGITYKEVLILIHLKGSYHKIGEFVNKLENESQFIKIKELKISANNQDVDKQNVKLLISLITR